MLASKLRIMSFRSGKFSLFVAVLIIVGWVVSACQPTAAMPDAVTAAQPAAVAHESVELTVFTAASLTEAFTELGKQFEMDHPGVTVVFNFAGSNQLAGQINQGAPADVFASANRAQMQVAIDGGRIVSGAQQTFVRNRLVVIYPNDNPAGLATLQDLAKSGVRVVFAATEVPVGQYSLDFLDKAVEDASLGSAFEDAVLANVVSYEENVRAVLSKVVLGEADAGIVYASDLSGDSADQVGRIDIPDALNTIATYPIAVVGDSAHSELAQAFIDLVLSPEGQDVLAKYGFIKAVQ